MQRSLIQTSVLVITLGALSSCGLTKVFQTQGSGPGTVDGLLSQIEQVHVECELAQQNVRESVDLLRSIVSPSFGGDPMTAYTALEAAVDDCRDQGKALDRAIQRMERVGGPFFDQWARDLSSFSSMELRLRSQQRLTDTLARYEEIVAAVEPARDSFDEYTATLRDHTLFLGNDLNSGSTSALEGDVRALTKRAKTLHDELGVALEAAQDYVRTAALHGELEARTGEAQPQAPSQEQPARRTRN